MDIKKRRETDRFFQTIFEIKKYTIYLIIFFVKFFNVRLHILVFQEFARDYQ